MRTPALAITSTGAAVLVLALTGCSSSTGSTSAQRATVKAGSSSCEVSQTAFTAGAVAFQVQNTGSDVTEVYVYAKGSDGAYDEVVGEVEDVAPGTTRELRATVGGGDYQVACKPGQKGSGIRTAIHVTGAAASTSAQAYDREVEVRATDFAFTGLAGFTAKKGERIEFKLDNAGRAPHNLTFFDASGKEVGDVSTLDPGEDGEAVIGFDEAGTYTYRCTVDGHADKGMSGSVTVA